jgi:site-specific DNA-cytosine methylase
MKAIGVNIFAGGFTVGVKRQFDVLAHYEHAPPYGYGEMHRNLPGLKVHHGGPDSWPRTPIYPGERERTRFIYCNPPCAPFSGASAGRATTWEQDPRLNCFYDCFNLLFDVRPNVLAIESVVASWTKAQKLSTELARRAAKEGYSTTVLFHDAQFLGVPQVRKRIFYVFHNVEFTPAEVDFDSQVTVRQALRGLKIPAASKKRWGPQLVPASQNTRNLLAQTPPGGRFAAVWDRLYPDAEPDPATGKRRGRPSFLEARLPIDRPMGVFMGGDKIFHHTENRLLYPEEICRLVGFPDDWQWEPKLIGQVGIHASQGVAPNVGEWLAKGVKASIERGRTRNRQTMETLDLRDALRAHQLLYDDPSKIEEAPPWDPPPMIAREPRLERAPRSPSAPRRPGSGAFIRGLLAEGRLSTAQILERVHAEFPGSKATAADVSWNKRELRLRGI